VLFLFFGYILVDYHQTRIAYQELISIMESENSIRREWMAAGGDKEMLTQAIETNEKMIDGMKYNLGWGGRYSHD